MMTPILAQISPAAQSVCQPPRSMLNDFVRQTHTAYTYEQEPIPIKKKQLLAFLDTLLEAAQTETESEEWCTFEDDLKQNRLTFGYSDEG